MPWSRRISKVCCPISDRTSLNAGHHIPLWLKTIDNVLAWDAAHPDDFTPPGTPKDVTRKNFLVLKENITSKQEELERKAAEQDREAGLAGSDDPYSGDGGAMFGTPQEMVSAYDPHVFDKFKIGVTTKSEVVKSLGKPEMWFTDADGTSTLNYPYFERGDVGLAVLGMAHRVSIGFKFDARKTLTAIQLPTNKAP